MTGQRASLSTFRANEHAKLPDHLEPESKEPARPKLIDKHFPGHSRGGASVQHPGSPAVRGYGTPPWTHVDRRGAKHAVREVRDGTRSLTASACFSWASERGRPFSRTRGVTLPTWGFIFSGSAQGWQWCLGRKAPEGDIPDGSCRNLIRGCLGGSGGRANPEYRGTASPHLPRVAGRPFFMVTCCASWISWRSRHFMQYPVIEKSFPAQTDCPSLWAKRHRSTALTPTN